MNITDYLLHVTVQVCYPQEAQFVRFETNWHRQAVIYEVQRSVVGSVVDVSYV